MNHITSTSNQTRRRVTLVGIAAVSAAMLATTVALPAFGAGGAAPSVAPLPAILPSVVPAVAPAIVPAVVTPSNPVHLCATTGTATLPNATPSGATTSTVNIWGYVLGDCTTGAGTATLGGAPTITANVGDAVTIVLHNGLPSGQATALSFEGQQLPTDATGLPAGAATRTYTFVATGVGTHLYEAGVTINGANAPAQVAMGMYGVFQVLPLNPPAPSDPSYSNNSATVLISDIDPALNAAPTTFDMRNFKPKYQLINGKAFPETASLVTAAPGDHLLLRYVNAGVNYHSMGILGANQRIVADDGHALAQPYTVVAQTVGPGQTYDAIVDVSTAAVAGTKLAVYDANLQLRNAGRRPVAKVSGVPYKTYGGALAFVDIGGVPPTGDTVGPVASHLVATTTTISADISDVTTGNSNVVAAEYVIDSGAAVPFPAFTPAPMVSVSATFSSLSGPHTIKVRGQDVIGNWGQFVSVDASTDTAGPSTTGVVITPSSTNGTVNVTLHATASDTATGGSNIAAAEYTIANGPNPVLGTLIVNNAAPVASVDATVSAASVNGLTVGSHVVSIRSQDSAGNWGQPVTANLVVDKTGPGTTGVLASPNPSNGLIGFNSATFAVRITASITDGTTNVATAEGFIDTVGANGAGFPFVPSDGSWSSLTEAVQADIPLATIRALANGNHTIYVHGRDAAGNWGATNSVILIVDKTVPTVTTFTVSPNTVLPANASVTLNATAADVGVGVTGGLYWIDGTSTPPSNATAFAGSSVSVPITTSTLAAGTHTIYLRVSDGAGNLSSVSSVPLYVLLAVNDVRSIAANGSATQTNDATTAQSLLANDQPIGVAGRAARLATAPVRTSGNGAGSITLSCPGSLGTAATPAVGGSTVCTNGRYRVTLTGVGNNNNQRAASKRGTFQFTYTETLNNVTSTTATVTITVT